MAFTIEDDYLLGALVVLLIVAIVLAFREGKHRHHHKKGSFTVIPTPPAGWDNARGGGLYGGTVPGWGEDYSRPPY